MLKVRNDSTRLHANCAELYWMQLSGYYVIVWRMHWTANCPSLVTGQREGFHYLGREWSEVMRKHAMTARFLWLETQLLQMLFSLLEGWSIWDGQSCEWISPSWSGQSWGRGSQAIQQRLKHQAFIIMRQFFGATKLLILFTVNTL